MSTTVAFVMKKAHSFVWPVVVREPADDGAIVEARFSARFKVLGNSKLNLAFEALKTADPTAPTDIEATFVREVLVDFADDQVDGNGKVVCPALRDESGERVVFSAETRDALLDVQYIKAALVAAYQQAMRGESAKRKNS